MNAITKPVSTSTWEFKIASQGFIGTFLSHCHITMKADVQLDQPTKEMKVIVFCYCFFFLLHREMNAIAKPVSTNT